VPPQILFERYGKKHRHRLYSFNQNGVHFIGLNNVMDLKAAAWAISGLSTRLVRRYVKGLSASHGDRRLRSHPHCGHIQGLGWGTDDSEQALRY